MTTMMSPPAGSQFMSTAPPRSGILLNASPSSSAPNSPKRTSYLLSPFSSNAGAAGTQQVSLSSHSSASSSTSSTDDIVSSTSATSAGGTQASTSPAAAHQPPRKIRFAPLPEPRRSEYEYDDDLLSPGFFTEVDSAASSPYHAAQALLSPPVSAHITPPTPTRAVHLNESHALSSCSTLGLSFDGSDPPDSGQATETNTIAGSDCGTDETHTLANCKKKSPRWARILRLPKPTHLKNAPRTPDEHGQFSLWRSSSRESTASVCSFRAGAFGSMLGSLSDSNASTASLGNPLPRRKSAGGADSLPVSPALSFRGGLSLKPVVSEVGTAATPAARNTKAHMHSSSAPSTVRRGTRLLNGRVYGSRPASSSTGKNPFANVRDTEPEFVEWGHGGMGSVQGAAGAGSSQWAALQSNKKLSVGHEDGSRVADEDDGSGMGWVKRRRQQREQERIEREEREAREKEKGKAAANDSEATLDGEKAETERAAEKEEIERAVSEALVKESEPSVTEVPGPVTPADASEEKELRVPQTSEEKATADEKREMKEEKEKWEKEYVYTAVTVPAPRPRHHHLHSHSHSLTNSALGTPTVETYPHVLGSTTPLGTPGTATGLGPSPLALAGVSAAVGTGDETSPPSSSASSSFEEESPLADKEEDRDVEGEGDEDEEEEEDDQARKTAIGAGVEKISRHKE